MPSYVHKPECHLADEFGMVEKNDLYFMWLSVQEPDNRMRRGNKIVEFNFIGDEMAPTQHMASGKYYTSKKKFRNETKAYGCIEVGNEKQTLLKPRKPIRLDRRQRRDDIRKSLHQLRNGIKTA